MKSAGLKIGIPRKGWRANKSLSPVMMRQALAVAASSRNLLQRQKVKVH